ncbi:uncharacterized protein LOC108155948 [Drosophila miranda]|uniref:uncharacterized protein LOC108155948 n=1 Tax=Drosophila miranda TaxID=7229 RepID=UPI0007E85664|nr:uncharacterized protein LOC108155948 [Drosophila miranda]
MNTPVLCAMMVLILLEGSAGHGHKEGRSLAQPRTDGAAACGENEIYSCRVCFEPSCYQMLYDDEPCHEGCVMACNCKLGFIRKKLACVVKDACCVGNICKTRKEIVVREAYINGVDPDRKLWAEPRDIVVEVAIEQGLVA